VQPGAHDTNDASAEPAWILPSTRWITRAADGLSFALRQHAPRPIANLVATGDYWRHRAATRGPVTFSEKLRYKMLRDRRRLLVVWADKLAVRDYVASVATPELLSTVYAAESDLAAVDRASLPRNFVVKVNHGSGGVVLVSDRFDRGTALPDELVPWAYYRVHPDSLDWQQLVAAVRQWLTCEYGGGRYREWAYTQVVPTVVVEELLASSTGAVPEDYKFFVFHGTARIAQVDSDRHGDHRQDLFNPDWTPFDGHLVARPSDAPPPPPPSLDAMLRISEELAGDTDFVRVDLYDLGDRIVFGEMTSYPLGGAIRFDPPECDVRVGHWWTVPRRYR
jgi:hypothetical protein